MKRKNDQQKTISIKIEKEKPLKVEANKYIETSKFTKIVSDFDSKFEKLKTNTNDFINEIKSENERFSKLVCRFSIFALVMIAILSVITTRYYVKKYNDLNDKYTYTSNQFNELNTRYEYLATQISDLYSQLKDDDIKVEAPINTAILTEKSNLSVEQINDIINQYNTSRNISDSKLTNIGQYIYNMEEEYNVNGLFCLAVAINESSTGTSNGAINYNNLFGLTKDKKLMKFISIEDCIQYWGNLMRYKYIDKGFTTIDTIQTKYCPKSSDWATKVTIIQNALAKYV